IRGECLEDLERHDPSHVIAGLGKALLIMHSPRDTIVSIDNAARIFMGAKHPKTFVSLDRADHLVSSQEDAAYAAEVLSAWASRYLTTTEQSRVSRARVAAAGHG